MVYAVSIHTDLDTPYIRFWCSL